MARNEQISNLRDKGYEVAQIMVPQSQDESNRPGVIMINAQNKDKVLVTNAGEIISLSAGGI